MTRDDMGEDNLLLARSTEVVDELNAKFYSRFPYPWPPLLITALEDPTFENAMVNQELGAWEAPAIPADARIWVAGCGTNQAVFTALRFPQATIVGSDVSRGSLAICAETARQLKLSNLKLREESINDTKYEECFDYVISTGVIHHNFDPLQPLTRLAAALKPTGVLELMVYNRFHWTLPATFQKAVRILARTTGSPDFESELSLAQKLIEHFPAENSLAAYLETLEGGSESMFADVLLQPVLHSYTVESLEAMAAACGLELLVPCINIFDRAGNTYLWNLTLGDPELQEAYDALPDTHRWHMTNLLLAENLPNLWFYLQHSDCGRPRKSEKEICESFLDTVFELSSTRQRTHSRQEDGSFRTAPASTPFPPPCRNAEENAILALVNGRMSMRDIFRRAGVDGSFQTVNRLRLKLTTPAFPRLRVARSAPR